MRVADNYPGIVSTTLAARQPGRRSRCRVRVGLRSYACGRFEVSDVVNFALAQRVARMSAIWISYPVAGPRIRSRPRGPACRATAHHSLAQQRRRTQSVPEPGLRHSEVHKDPLQHPEWRPPAGDFMALPIMDEPVATRARTGRARVDHELEIAARHRPTLARAAPGDHFHQSRLRCGTTMSSKAVVSWASHRRRPSSRRRAVRRRSRRRSRERPSPS